MEPTYNKKMDTLLLSRNIQNKYVYLSVTPTITTTLFNDFKDL